MWGTPTLVVRTEGDPGAMAESIRKTLLSMDETSRSKPSTPMGKAMEYAERAEYMYIAPGQATVSALLALFWLKVAELEAHGIVETNETNPDPSSDE